MLLSKSLVHLLPKDEALLLTAQHLSHLGREPHGAGRAIAARAGRGASQAGPHPVPPGRRQLNGGRPRAIHDPPVSGAALEQCQPPTLPATTSATRPKCCGCTCTTRPGCGTPRPWSIWARPSSRWAIRNVPCSRSQDCIQQHPRNVAVYRARLLASRAAVNLGDLKQAEILPRGFNVSCVTVVCGAGPASGHRPWINVATRVWRMQLMPHSARAGKRVCDVKTGNSGYLSRNNIQTFRNLPGGRGSMLLTRGISPQSQPTR